MRDERLGVDRDVAIARDVAAEHVGETHAVGLFGGAREPTIRAQPHEKEDRQQHQAGGGDQADFRPRSTEPDELGIDRILGDGRTRLGGRLRFVGHDRSEGHPTCQIDTAPPRSVATKNITGYRTLCQPTIARSRAASGRSASPS